MAGLPNQTNLFARDFSGESAAKLSVKAKSVNTVRFDGADYQPQRDNPRLISQYEEIFQLMSDGKWRTLQEIARATQHPEASISAQLRHMKKPRFGGHTVERQYLCNGLYSYRLIVNREVRQ